MTSRLKKGARRPLAASGALLAALVGCREEAPPPELPPPELPPRAIQ